MAAHRYWRVFITATGSNVIGVSEIELRDTVGGADLTGSGTASASAIDGSNVPAQAVDNNTGTDWSTWPANPPQWWAYDFGAGNAYDIRQLRFTPRSGWPTEAPKDFDLQYSDDGTTWVSKCGFAGVTYSGVGATTVTVPDSDPAPHRRWRLYIISTAGTYVGISEIELRSSSGGADLTGSGTASHSSSAGGWEADKAVDNNTGTAWATYPAPASQWWAYDFGAGATHRIVEVRITPRTDGYHAEAPQTFHVQYSDDGTAWPTAWSVTGASWPSASPQVFTDPTPVLAVHVTQDAVEVIVGSGQGTRVTQDAVEVIIGAGQGTRVTQDAVEVVVGLPKGALVTQDAVEVVLRDTGPQAAGLKLSQEVLETAQFPLNNLRLSQEVLEVAKEQIVPVRLTQEVLEYAREPDNQSQVSQVCLEVMLAGEFLPVPPRRNHSFIKVYMATGHGPNASFNG